MKKMLIFGIILFILFAALNYYVRSVPFEEDATGRPVVSTTIFPLYDLVRIIGKDVVETRLILPPGASPHTFEASPRIVTQINKSKRVFAIGHGLDDWAIKLVDQPEQVILVDRNIDLHESTEEHAESTDENTEPMDPHYWLSVLNTKIISQTIAEELTQLVPEKSEIIAANLASYEIELDELDVFIREELSGLSNKDLITFHEAWYYFAQEYQLNILATFEPSAGREPTPQYLAQLSDTIAQTGIKVLYAEPQFSTAPLEAFLSDLGVSVAILDPIGGATGTESFIKLMRTNVTTLTQNQ